MGEREALLRAVCENPDDDLPRLVFADWLEEHGEPERAEFIRLQCEMAKSIRQFHPRLIRRERQLRESHGSRWRLELPDHPGVRWHGLHRGFINAATVDDATGLVSIAEEALFKTPLTSLRFSYCLVNGGLWKLPLLRSLTELELYGCVFEDADLFDLADPSCLPRLTKLVLAAAEDAGGYIGSEVLRRLHQRYGKGLSC